MVLWGCLIRMEDGKLIQETLTASSWSILVPFSSNELADFEASLSAIHPKVTPAMNATLTANFRAEEVWNALQQMHPTKSPGPDSMSPIFLSKILGFIR